MVKWRCNKCNFEGHLTEFPFDYVPDEDGFDDNVPYCPNCNSRDIEEIEE